jgi:hypothetical protein
MSSSQPPQPPLGGQPPQGDPQPGYGPPPGAQPPAGPPSGHSTYGQPTGSGQGVSFDAKRLKMADYAIAGLTLLFLVLSFFTWYDLGDDFFGVDISISGWTDGQIKFAFFLFLLATVWALLPAVTHIEVGFPRSLVTVGLAALGFLLTLFAWFDTFDFEFSIFALLGMLTAAAILAFAVLSLLPELRNRPALPGALSSASQWANRTGSGAGETAQPQGQPGPPPAQPPTYGQPGSPGQPGAPGGPDRPGGPA